MTKDEKSINIYSLREYCFNWTHFLMSVFDKALWNELVEDGFFHITYALILIVPFLAVLFL